VEEIAQISYFSSITLTASFLIQCGLALAPTLGVGGKRLSKLVCEAQVIDYQPAPI
jgi:hypothetical protein